MAIAVIIISSCGSGATKDKTEAPEEVMELLHTVPSDALAISVRRSCSDAVSLLDSAAVLRMVDYGRNADSPAVISWCFDGDLSPILAIDAGRSSSAEASAHAMMSGADSLGLFSAYYAPDDLGGRHSIMVITPSEALLTAVNRHVTERRSILDAAEFGSALAFAGNSRSFTILRNSGATHLLPAWFLDGIYNRRSAAAFLRTVSDWITITPEGGDTYRLDATRGESPSYYTNLFTNLPFGDSRLGDILPSDTEFAISLPVPQPEFRDAFQRYQDAAVRYTQYVRKLDALTELTGKNPADWEKETGVKEVGLIVSAGSRIIAVRPAKASEDSTYSENPWPGFVPALYGSAFSIPDDSMCASVSGWLIYGSASDVKSFLDSQNSILETNWPRKGTHIVMYKSGKILCWSKKGINLWNSNQ